MANRHALVTLAVNAEDAASGLHLFRDSLSQYSTQITTIVSLLFAHSSLLQEIHHAQCSPQYQPAFYRIRDDMSLLLPSLGSTYDTLLLMFRRAPDRTYYQSVWEDLRYQMERQERLSLLQRVQLYTNFLEAQRDVVKGRHAPDIRQVRRQLGTLLEAQEALNGARTPGVISNAGSDRVRAPVRQRISSPFLASPPQTPIVASMDWSQPYASRPSPVAPEAVLSPGFGSRSSPTSESSQTSYGSDPAVLTLQQPIHWARKVFRGDNPLTPFNEGYQLDVRSACDGQVEPGALHELRQDGFQRAIALPFDRERLWVQLYWRPDDNRARIFVHTRDRSGRDLYHCTTMQSLKVIRQGSCLRLCKLLRIDDTYVEWARLNFYSHERMVLFYSTFVAMKYQDEREVPALRLHDFLELNQPQDGEALLYGGLIKHGDLQHNLRLFRDQGSGVVRIEASAYRGPMKDVPLWTAFITQRTNDPGWAYPEDRDRSIISLAVIRPPPYVFLSGYAPQHDSHDQYFLHFVSRNDASHFIEVWNRLCNSARA